MNKFRNYFAALLLAILSLSLLFLPSYTARNRADVAAVITQSRGTIEYLAEDSSKWTKARMGMFLYEGDELRTGKTSFAKIIFVSGAQMQLNQNTHFTVDKTPVISRGMGNEVRLRKGETYVNAYRKGVRFNMTTPTAVVAVRGTQFIASVGRGRMIKGPLMTAVLVLEGTVEVKNDNGSVKVKENQMTEVAPGNAPPPPVPITSDMNQQLVVWKDEAITKTKGKLKIFSETGSTLINEPVSIDLEVQDDKGNIVSDYSGKIEISPVSPTAQISIDSGKKWNNTASAKMTKGHCSIMAKDSVNGYLILSFSAEDLEGVTFNIDVKSGQETKKKTLKLKFKTEDGEEKNLRIKFGK